MRKAGSAARPPQTATSGRFNGTTTRGFHLHHQRAPRPPAPLGKGPRTVPTSPGTRGKRESDFPPPPTSHGAPRRGRGIPRQPMGRRRGKRALPLSAQRAAASVPVTRPPSEAGSLPLKGEARQRKRLP